MPKGKCTHKTNFFKLLTVTDKGQIAIPTELRDALKIKKGDKLIIVARKDGQGFNLLKTNVMGDFIDKLSNN